MVNYISQYQVKFDEFCSLYQLQFNFSNRWKQLGSILPWYNMVAKFTKQYSLDQDNQGISPRIPIRAMIIKHKLKLTDEDTIEIIRENPYMQLFLRLDEFISHAVFSPSLFVDIRRRLGATIFRELSALIIKLSQTNQNLTKDNNRELKIDTSVADQQIRYPNDLGLIAEARVRTEAILDILFNTLREELSVKPRTYRKQAHKIYLSQAKKKTKKELRKALRNGLNCVK